jgi:hypothetical protein
MFNGEISYKQYIVDWLKGKRYSISQQTYSISQHRLMNPISETRSPLC